MFKQPYVIRVSSEKGGVGKTTVAANLALILHNKGYQVLLVDSDMTSPSIALHFGLENVQIGYEQFTLRKKSLDEVTMYAKGGLRVVPGALSRKPFILTEKMFKSNVTKYKKTKYDFVIVDSQPGVVLPVWSSQYLDEAIVVTTPDLPSFTSCMHLTQYLERKKIKYSIIVNKVTNRSYELAPDEMTEIYPNNIMGRLPHDEIVPISIDREVPAVLLKPSSRFARSLDNATRNISYMRGETRLQKWWKKILFGWLN